MGKMTLHSAEVPIRCVVFDLDGTLVDTLGEITSGLNAGLGAVGVAPHDRENVRGWIGDGVEKLIERALPRRHSDRSEDVLRAALSAYRSRVGSLSQVYPGIADCLQSLRQDGLGLAVLTNKSHEVATVMVQRFFPDVFEVVEGAAEGRPLKPEAAALRGISGRIGIDVAEVLMVGDSSVDIEAAANAGARVAAVTWGFRSRSELAAGSPDWLIDHAKEIVALVASRRAAPMIARRAGLE